MNSILQKKEQHLRIADKIQRSSKYRNICPDTIDRAVEWACLHHKSEKEAAKSARRKLHQIYGAYFNPNWAKHLEHHIQALKTEKDPDVRHRICLSILKGHSSAAERIPIMKAAYEDLLTVIPPPKTVLDLACGFNPFALPWMGELAKADYTAVDIDRQLLEFVGDYGKAVKRRIQTDFRDIVVSPPRKSADMALLLKTVPLLEHMEKKSSFRILKALKARHVVVSFPLHTLGGNKKGMEATYRQMAGELFSALGVQPRELMYATEMFYIYEKST